MQEDQRPSNAVTSRTRDSGSGYTPVTFHLFMAAAAGISSASDLHNLCQPRGVLGKYGPAYWDSDKNNALSPSEQCSKSLDLSDRYSKAYGLATNIFDCLCEKRKADGKAGIMDTFGVIPVRQRPSREFVPGIAEKRSASSSIIQLCRGWSIPTFVEANIKV